MQLLKWLEKHPCSAIVILADSAVWELYDTLFDGLERYASITLMTIQGGEQAKSLETVSALWKKMLENRIDKEALLLNVGGGSVSDAGGLVAATYKRGIRYINVPTTLLAMVDAATGGKTAINFNGIKNSIGVIALPQEVFISTLFLQSLPGEELLNGFAELLKYALIADSALWRTVRNLTEINGDTVLPKWIEGAVAFKKRVVAQDLHDRGVRRCLNFGHTAGHALEAFFYGRAPLTHGHAVALGMAVEAWLSHFCGSLPRQEAIDIQQFIARFYPFVKLQDSDVQEITALCLQDKKSSFGAINCTLLAQTGHYTVNNSVSSEDMQMALHSVFS
ncbi:MAG: 3-dehydroquinate synthase [Bacteroidales bacterium]|jgi:3-dehydroquinate synthase|nr:3-dehydroquinate synthase [Bacteroidales bacterium]